MKQDDILREKFGRENHFRVPEGYFDDFADRMMEKRRKHLLLKAGVRFSLPRQSRIYIWQQCSAVSFSVSR